MKKGDCRVNWKFDRVRCFALALMAVAAGFNLCSASVALGYFCPPLEDMSHGWLVRLSVPALWGRAGDCVRLLVPRLGAGAIWVCFPCMGLAWFRPGGVDSGAAERSL